MSRLDNFLANAQREGKWSEAVAEGTKNRNFPDGTYIAQITGAELGESKKENLQIVWTHAILEGDLRGQDHKDYLQLEGKLGLQPLVWRLTGLGYDTTSIDIKDLPALLEDLVDRRPVIKFTLKTDKGSDFQNMRIAALLPNYDPAEAEEYASTAIEQDEDTAEAAAQEIEEVEEAEVLPGVKITFSEDDGSVSVGIVQTTNDKKQTLTVKSIGKPAKEIKLSQVIKVIPEEADKE